MSKGKFEPVDVVAFINRVKELMRYEAETGFFFSVSPCRGRFVGSRLGSLKKDGYTIITIDYKAYPAHRIAWLLVYWAWPVGDIDHINGLRSDNRIVNLRDVPRYVNIQNQRNPMIGNSSGKLGVCRRGEGRFESQIHVDGKDIYLGTFFTAEEAHTAYVNAKRKYHKGCAI